MRIAQTNRLIALGAALASVMALAGCDGRAFDSLLPYTLGDSDSPSTSSATALREDGGNDAGGSGHSD